MKDSLISENSEPEVYTAPDKTLPEDYEMSDTLRSITIDRLEEKLTPLGSGDISMGNYVLGPDFARDYLRYLKNGGSYGVEGFRKFVWSPKNNIQEILLDHDRLSQQD